MQKSHIIIGAGVVGIALARALQRSGRPVTVVDPEPPGSKTSFGNAGYIAIDHVQPLARPAVVRRALGMLFDPLGPLAIHWPSVPRTLPWMLRFARATRTVELRRGTAALSAMMAEAGQAWLSEIQASGLGDLFAAKGALYVYENADRFRAGAGERATLERCGVRLQTVTGDEAREMAPGLSAKIVAGVHYPDGIHTVNPFRLVGALAERFRSDGGTILAAKALGFERSDAGVDQVHTSGGTLAAETVTLAAGVAARGLARMLGFSAPLVAERGYHLMLDAPGRRFDLPVSPIERSFFITPMEMGVRLAGTVEIAMPDRPPSWRRAEVLLRHFGEVFPGLEARETSRWMGERPTLPDFRPAIGRAPRLKNVYCAYGHQHVCLTLATVTARLLVGLMDGEPLPAELAACDPGRFG